MYHLVRVNLSYIRDIHREKWVLIATIFSLTPQLYNRLANAPDEETTIVFSDKKYSVNSI